MKILSVTAYVVAAILAAYAALFVLGIVLFGGAAFALWALALRFGKKAKARAAERQDTEPVEITITVDGGGKPRFK